MPTIEIRPEGLGSLAQNILFVDGQRTGISCESMASYPVERPNGGSYNFIVLSRKRGGTVEYAAFVAGCQLSDVEWISEIIGKPSDVSPAGVHISRGLSVRIFPWPKTAADQFSM